jgi:hypothetical protein
MSRRSACAQAPRRPRPERPATEGERLLVTMVLRQAYHHGQGLEEHHQGTAAAPTWSGDDKMWG